jgi:hypothetical protein
MNPIDRRHANRKGIRCPMFWRRIGLQAGPWIPALWMWALFAAFFVILLPFGHSRGVLAEYGLPVNAVTASFLAFVAFLETYLIVISVLLGSPVGVAWLVLMWVAIRRGLVRAGTAAALLPVVLFFPLLPLLDYSRQ